MLRYERSLVVDRHKGYVGLEPNIPSPRSNDVTPDAHFCGGGGVKSLLHIQP